jgi:NAD(P)-dependent dehydrogenase (short-subunit alcohol dehydrogenase family)
LPEPPARFTADDVALFARASHDVNPLHVSASHARRTPFGEPVVHGVLAALACLGRLPPRAGSLRELKVQFAEPVYRGVDYRVQIGEKAGAASFCLLDGSRVLLRGSAAFSPGEAAALPAGPATAPRGEAPDRDWGSLAVGETQEGSWGPDRQALAELLVRWDLHGKGIGEGQLAALLLCSYVVGMEVPGQRALFSRLGLAFPEAGPARPDLDYRARIAGLDERFGLVRLDVVLGGGTGPAQAELRAFVRSAPVEAPAVRLDAEGGSLAGKVALVVGGSRGLGAGLVVELARAGAAVSFSYAESAGPARDLVAAAPHRLHAFRADAADAEACRLLLEDVLARHGRLDILVLSACPPLRPMELHPDSAERLCAWLQTAFAMVAQPLAAALPGLDRQQGLAVLVSSSAVLDPPAEWPHYVAAKRAIEGLAASLVPAWPRTGFLVARPPRLHTDYVQRLGELRAGVPVAVEAERIVREVVARLGQAGLFTLDP